MLNNISKLLFLTALIFPLDSFSYMSSRWNKPRIASIDLQYHTLTDLVSDPNNPRKDLSGTYGANLNLRFYRTFSLITSYFKAQDSSFSGYGLGFRVDLPGFFWLGGVANDFVRRRKKQSVNTYLQWSKFLIKEGGLDSYVADRIGFGCDVFITEFSYLNFEIMSYSHQGNQFMAFGTGLGFEF